LTNGLNNYGPSPLMPTTFASNLTVMGLTRGSGVTQNSTGAAKGWGGTGFTSGDAVTATTANQFATFGIAANAGYLVSFTSVSQFDYRRSGTGPANGVLQYQIGSGSFNNITNLNYSSTSANGSSIGAIDLSSFSELQNVGAGTNVTFRIVNYGGTSSVGTWYVFDTANSSALDFALQGTVTGTQPVVMVPPVLSITISNGSVILSWPTLVDGFVLQQNSDLSTANWMDAGSTAITNGASKNVLIAPNLGENFFRLFHP